MNARRARALAPLAAQLREIEKSVQDLIETLPAPPVTVGEALLDRLHRRELSNLIDAFHKARQEAVSLYVATSTWPERDGDAAPN